MSNTAVANSLTLRAAEIAAALAAVFFARASALSIPPVTN